VPVVWRTKSHRVVSTTGQHDCRSPSVTISTAQGD
jgi:hypothetical protein